MDDEKFKRLADDENGCLTSVGGLQEKLSQVTTDRFEIWSRVVKEPLFQFLKHDPTGRTILCLLANGDISLGKAAEAITEKFVLGLDPVLPEWNGYTVEQPHDKD